MKVGLIIVFDSSDHVPIKFSISETLSKMEGVLFCLVNNNCSELFGSQLDELAEEHDYVNVIHIKKRKPNLWAVRAGSRYLKNNFNLKFLAYIADLKGEELVNAIEIFANDHKQLIRDSRFNGLDKLVKQSFLSKMFCVKTYYERNFKPHSS